ncbi:MAG: diversity-generating retroelement protein Avd [Candidatus Saccharimonadales bacterium]
MPIVHSLYQLYQNLHTLTLKFPKSQRYTLGSSVQTQLLSALEGVIAAAGTGQPEVKLRYLQTVSTKIDLLRLLTRLSKDCQCISNKQYLELESQLHEIGRMLGGWLKSIK